MRQQQLAFAFATLIDKLVVLNSRMVDLYSFFGGKLLEFVLE